MENSTSTLQNNQAWLLKSLRFWTALFLILIVLYGALGVFSRPVLDDFCLAARANNVGVIGTVSYQYWNWSGNVIGLYYQVVGAVFYLHPVSPLALLTLWVVTFAWLIWEFFILVGLPRHRLLAVLLGAMLTLGMVDSSPNVGQTLYWLNGTANYGPTSALFVMLLALLIRTARNGANRTSYIAAALLTFTAVCGQITMTVYCVGLLVPLLLFVYTYRQLPHRADLLRVVGVALAAGAIGTAIVMLTPGNDIRQASLESVGLMRMGILDAALRNMPFSVGMLVLSAALFAPITHVLLFSIGHLGALILRPPVLAGRTLPRYNRRYVLLGGIAAGLVIFYFGGFASTYSMGVLGPQRAWAAPQSLWIVLVLLIGYLHGLCFQPIIENNRQRIRYALVFCMAGFVLVQAVNWVMLIAPYQNFARQHDTRIAAIESAVRRGETDVTIPPYQPPLNQFMFLDDADDLLCLRWYYPITIEEALTAN